MKTTFNHAANTLIEGLGFTEEQAKDLETRANDYANRVVNEKLAQTELAEILASNLSYNELLYFATIGMVEKIRTTLESLNPQDIKASIVDKIKKFSTDELEDLCQKGTMKLDDNISFKVMKIKGEEAEKLLDALKKSQEEKEKDTE